MRALIFAFSLLLAVQTQALSIWKVSGHDRTFYLFGTIHVLKPSAYPLPQAYEDTLSQCDQLWLEADVGEMNDAKTLGEVQKLMLLPAGQTLRDQLSDEAHSKLTELAQKAGVPLGALQGLKPWAAANQLTLLIFQKEGFTSEGLDIHLQRMAFTKGIEVKAFETIVWQLQMFDDLANQYGDDFMEFSTEDMDDVTGLVDTIFEQWKNGDYQSMYQQADFEDYPAVEQALLINRNRNWVNIMMQFPVSETACAAVGALHMAGENGLIQQFESRGYKVSMVR
ncbi:MAG: TraB/GumN family protein [Reinekea sp.]|jgi:uncharacterized protein